ncbi:hypothetical protein [Halomonas ventosae]|nr:hypothetical protein [Halomonas ventosae]
MLATLLHRWRWLGAWTLAIGGVLEGREDECRMNAALRLLKAALA